MRIKAHAVRHVENFPPELQIRPLGKRKRLVEPGVPAVVAVAAQRVAGARFARQREPERTEDRGRIRKHVRARSPPGIG